MELPQPTNGHERLQKLAGTWAGEEHMEPTKWRPEPYVRMTDDYSRPGQLDSRVDLSEDGVEWKLAFRCTYHGQ